MVCHCVPVGFNLNLYIINGGVCLTVSVCLYNYVVCLLYIISCKYTSGKTIIITFTSYIKILIYYNILFSSRVSFHRCSISL